MGSDREVGFFCLELLISSGWLLRFGSLGGHGQVTSPSIWVGSWGGFLSVMLVDAFLCALMGCMADGSVVTWGEVLKLLLSSCSDTAGRCVSVRADGFSEDGSAVTWSEVL